MKAILEFNLPEEAELHHNAVHGSEWRWAMDDLARHLRSERKHADHSAEEYKMLDQIYDKLFEVLQDRGLKLYG